MKSLTLSTVAMALVLASGSVLAARCPLDIKKIDAALADNPALDAAKLAKVKELRAAGQDLHDSGKHRESVDALAEAMRILGIQ